MTNQSFFVTGALGCIGAWVVRNLVREGTNVTVFDLGTDPHRLRLILTADELDHAVAEVEKIVSHPETVILTFTVLQVWGRKPIIG